MVINCPRSQVSKENPNGALHSSSPSSDKFEYLEVDSDSTKGEEGVVLVVARE